MKNSIFNEEYSKMYDFNNYDKKLEKITHVMTDFFEEYKILTKNHVDFGCGTGYFCKLINELKIKTMGIDISNGILNVAREKYPNILFENGDIVNYKCKNKVDFISCNYDTVNHLVNFDDWKTFFENVYDNLNDKGIFLFDFVTTKKFEGTNEIEFSTRDKRYDYLVCRIPIDSNKIVSKYIYYLNNNGLYKKIEQSIIEAFFENDRIFNALENIGFKILKKYNKDFEDLKDNSNRIYVICQK